MMLTETLKRRGWVIRPAEKESAAILVRGARAQDDPFDFKVGYIYAETEQDAAQYDAAHGYID